MQAYKMQVKKCPFHYLLFNKPNGYLLRELSLVCICEALTWRSPFTITRFSRLNVASSHNLCYVVGLSVLQLSVFNKLRDADPLKKTSV